jgi:uncharacterized membrane protein YbhN (UPF0104 family)
VRRQGRRAARPVLGALVVAALVWRLGTGPFLDGLRAVRPGTVLGAIAIGAATTVCSAWRWRVVARALGLDLPVAGATAAYYRSQFLNSALPGGVLGDVHRGLRHGIDAGDLGRGVRAVVWERSAGQLVQAVIAAGALLFLPSPLHPAMPAVAGVGVLAAGVLLITGRALVRHGPGRLTVALRTVGAEARDALLQPTGWPVVLLASVLVVGGYLGTFLLAAHAVGLHGSATRLLPPAMIILLAAAIPLNVGGWGPREGVAAWVFAASGWGAGAGAATATAFGVLTLAAVLPGAVVLVADRRRPPQRAGTRESDGPPEPLAGIVPSGARADGALDG